MLLIKRGKKRFKKEKKKKKTQNQQTLYLSPGVMWFSAGTDEAVKTLVSESCVEIQKNALFVVQHKSLFRQQCSHCHQEGVERK